MKKVFLVLCVVAIGFAFTSCKKDCKCSGSYEYTLLDEPYKIEIPEYSAGELKKADCEAVTFTLPAGLPDDVKLTFTCKSE